MRTVRSSRRSKTEPKPSAVVPLVAAVVVIDAVVAVVTVAVVETDPVVTESVVVTVEVAAVVTDPEPLCPPSVRTVKKFLVPNALKDAVAVVTSSKVRPVRMPTLWTDKTVPAVADVATRKVVTERLTGVKTAKSLRNPRKKSPLVSASPVRSPSLSPSLRKKLVSPSMITWQPSKLRPKVSLSRRMSASTKSSMPRTSRTSTTSTTRWLPPSSFGSPKLSPLDLTLVPTSSVSKPMSMMSTEASVAAVAVVVTDPFVTSAPRPRRVAARVARSSLMTTTSLRYEQESEERSL